MVVNLVFIPNKAEENLRVKLQGSFDDRNRAVARWFGVEPRDVKVCVCASKGYIASRLEPGESGLGTFSGYSRMYDEVLIVDPVGAKPIFGDNLDKQILIHFDYAIIKYYLKHIFYPNPQDFKLYYKYVAESLAKIASGNFQEQILRDVVKYSFDKRPLKKDQELELVLFIMLKNSGLDYIFSHLKTIMEDQDIKKTVFTIYKKSFNELVGQYKREIEDYEKNLKLAVGKKR